MRAALHGRDIMPFIGTYDVFSAAMAGRHFDALFIELGATRVIESWGDDVPDGKVTDFRRAVQATAEETVAFSWVEWPDKATRDAGMKKMLEDPRMDPSTPGNPPMPFDGKRMIFGGFEQVVEVKA
jgi:uncharacterized protein YbaA (DUF1428 family)